MRGGTTASRTLRHEEDDLELELRITYLRKRVAALIQAGGFAEDDVTSGTNLMAALNECIPELKRLKMRLGDEVWESFVNLSEELRVCVREGHNWTRFQELSSVPPGGFGRSAKQRKCRDCNQVHTKYLAWNGAPNGNYYPQLDIGARIPGARGDRRIYPRHHWLLERYFYITEAIQAAEARVGTLPHRPHLRVVAA